MAGTPLFGPGGQAGTRRKLRLDFPLPPRIKARFLRRRRGRFSPPHSRRNQRLMIPNGPVWPPGPGITWPWRHTFLQRTKVLPIFNSDPESLLPNTCCQQVRIDRFSKGRGKNVLPDFSSSVERIYVRVLPFSPSPRTRDALPIAFSHRLIAQCQR
jgi:hypothetical protein